MREEGDEYVFSSPVKQGQPLNPTAFNDLLIRMKVQATPHGIARSSFRDWIADCTEFPRDLAEMCLGHVVSGVEGAYRRLDMLKVRRKGHNAKLVEFHCWLRDIIGGIEPPSLDGGLVACCFGFLDSS